MELRHNNLKPGGYGNWEEIKKKSSNSDEICESDIEKTEKFFLQNWYIAILPFWYPKIYGKWLKKCVSGRIWVKLKPINEENRCILCSERLSLGSELILGLKMHLGAKNSIWICFATATWLFWTKNGVKSAFLVGLGQNKAQKW